MKHESAVIDKTHGATQCPHLTMQIETAASETSAKPQSALTGDTLTYHPRRRKQSQPLLITHQNGAQQTR